MERIVSLKLDWPRLFCRLRRTSITFLPVSWSVASIFTLSLLMWWVLLTFLLFFDDQGASWTIKIAFILPQSVVQWVGSLFCTVTVRHLKTTPSEVHRFSTSNFHLFMTSGTKNLKTELIEEKKAMKWEINQYQGTNTKKTFAMEMSQSKYIPESDLQRKQRCPKAQGQLWKRWQASTLRWKQKIEKWTS